MSRRAWAYVIGVLIAGAWVVGMMLSQPRPETWPWLAFVVLLALASLAHLTGATGAHHEIWQTNLVFLFAGLLMLPPPLFVWLVLIPHILEWAKENLRDSTNLRQWYIQPFNIAGHYLAGFGAYLVLARLLPESEPFYSTAALLAVFATALVYITINHYLVGQVIVLARNISWKDAGILNGQSLLGELTLLVLGYTVAVLWQSNPLLIIPALAPLVLINRSLRVPQLEKEAHTDAKTGLLNAGRWRQLVEEELERAQRFDRPLAMIMADLDHLRSINNIYGHLAGDVVITDIGAIIKHNVREYDIAGRFGGEEFAIVLPEANLETAQNIAERIRQAVEQAQFVVRSNPDPIHATITLGVMIFPDDADSLETLIHKADLALYHAKMNGRNRVALAADIPIAQLDSVSVADLRPSLDLHAAETPSVRTLIAAEKATVSPPLQASPTPDLIAANSAKSAADLNGSVPAQSGSRHIPFRIVVIFLAAALALYGFYLNPLPDLLALAIFSTLALIAELFSITLYQSSTLSVSAATVFAAALVTGVPGLAVISAVISITHYVRSRPLVYKTIFNWAAHFLAGLAPIIALKLTGLDLNIANLPLLLLPMAVAALASFLAESLLIATVVSLSKGKSSMIQIWQEHFQWLTWHYLALGLMGFFLAIAYVAIGLSGALIFTLPVLMMYYVEKQYTDRTEKSVLELQRMNEELAAANSKIIAANDSIQRQNDELFLTLSKAIDARDPYVLGHASQVAKYAMAIGNEMGLSSIRVEQLRQAGFLHDIGKIGISERILHKPTHLTDEEFAHVRAHVSIGADLLETNKSLEYLTPFIRHHHENWDGTGYPEGLKGESIPLEARILSVCDAVEAMASDRPYNKAKSLHEIVIEVKRCAGTQFDPAVVEAFCKVVTQNGTDFVINSAPQVQRSHSADEVHRLRFGDLFSVQNRAGVSE